MPKIAVLLHDNDTRFALSPPNCLIALLMREWQAMGFGLEVIRGIERFVPADVIIAHVDLTVIPEDYRGFLLKYPIVINKQMLDISKTKISSNLLKRNDDYTGPVIVKTDRNYGGVPETRLVPEAQDIRPLSSRILRKISSRLWPGSQRPVSWKHVEYLDTSNYPVFASLHNVPKGVFENKNLVVEKFIPEMDGDSYCVRYCYFLCDKDVNIVLKSKAKAVKYSNSFHQQAAPVPPELRSIRQRLGFDYGKFDYVLRDGRVVLFDVNRTPALDPRNEIARKFARHLAEGIWSKLNRPHE